MNKKVFLWLPVLSMVLFFPPSSKSIAQDGGGNKPYGSAQIKPKSPPPQISPQPLPSQTPSFTSETTQASVTINNEAPHTIKRDVVLKIVGRGVEYRASEDPNFSGAAWRPYYGSPVHFTLKPLRNPGPEVPSIHVTRQTIYMNSRYSQPNFGKSELRTVYFQLRTVKPGYQALSTVAQDSIVLRPAEKIYDVRPMRFWTEAKKRGFKSSAVNCYPGSQCNSTMIDGVSNPTKEQVACYDYGTACSYWESQSLFITEGLTNANGGKFEFNMFSGKNLKAGWSLVGYNWHHRTTLGWNHAEMDRRYVGSQIISAPNTGSRNLMLRVRIHADASIQPGNEKQGADFRIKKRRCYFTVNYLYIRGPNLQDPYKDAFE